MNYPAMLAFACGFASLSIEILWVRLYGYAQNSTPAAFGFVLMAYLLGIAAGAKLGGHWCQTRKSENGLWGASLLALLLSGVASLLLPQLFAELISHGIDEPLSATAVIAASSALLAFVFPIAHHLGAGQARTGQGRRFAAVYTANVAGAAIGPLLTGYVLLEHLSLQQAFGVIGLLQMMAALGFAIALRPFPRQGAMRATAVVLAFLSAVAVATQPPHALIEVFHAGASKVKAVIENRHGVITILEGHEADDIVYGGNVYDGRTNVDPIRNSNGLNRPLLLAALQPQPKRVLVIGMSIGTWLALVNGFPGVEQIDVLEINPGYIRAAQDYPIQSRAMRDPKVRLEIDDARRWLRQYPERRYDLVIMNTTLHWRANAGLMLSAEFMREIKAHMAPGAVMAFNATQSADAFYTAAQVFQHAYRYINFVYAADFDFRQRKDSSEARAIFRRLRLEGEALFAPNSPEPERFLAQPFWSLEHDQKRAARPLQMITDENMITEFKYGRGLY